MKRFWMYVAGAMPRQNHYLIIVNQGPSDGGAFEGSFSQLSNGPATSEGKLVWGLTMAHELLYFWNGLSLIPASLNEECFKEGFTDYVTSVGMYRAGLFDEAWLYRRFEAMQNRYAIGRSRQTAVTHIACTVAAPMSANFLHALWLVASICRSNLSYSK